MLNIKLLIYSFFISLITYIFSQNDYIYCFFFSYNINIDYITDILLIFFTEYFIVIILFTDFLNNVKERSINTIIRSKNYSTYIMNKIINYYKYIMIYYIYYALFINIYFYNQVNLNYIIQFLFTSLTNSIILFLIFTIIEINFKLKDIQIIYIISIFIIILNSSWLYGNKFLSKLYTLINNTNYLSFSNYDLILSVICSIILTLVVNKTLAKYDLI